MMAPVSTSAAAGLFWIVVGAVSWPTFVYVAARVAARRAQRQAERAAWTQVRRETRQAERIWDRLHRPLATKPSPIAISFHATDHLAAVERLLSRLPHSLREPS